METRKNPVRQRQKKTFVLVDQLNLDRPPAFRLLKQNQLSLFIKEFIESFGEVESISFNENVNGYYPDIIFSYMGVVFIIEIDEHQHKKGISYSADREKERTNALRSYFKSLILVRINPDKSNTRPIPMISMYYNEESRAKEIIVNAGEVEHRHGEVEKVLRWLFFNIKQQREQAEAAAKIYQPLKFEEHKLFFDLS